MGLERSGTRAGLLAVGVLALAAAWLLGGRGERAGFDGGSSSPAALPVPVIGGAEPIRERGSAGEPVAVERVIDGDTLVVGGGRRVRLIGVDAPESVAPDAPVDCFGPEAAAFLGGLLPAGSTIRLIGDLDPLDSFDRELAHVVRDRDDLLVNAELVRSGHAMARAYPPNVARQDVLDEQQDAARTAGAGLWSACRSP